MCGNIKWHPINERPVECDSFSAGRNTKIILSCKRVVRYKSGEVKSAYELGYFVVSASEFPFNSNNMSFDCGFDGSIHTVIPVAWAYAPDPFIPENDKE